MAPSPLITLASRKHSARRLLRDAYLTDGRRLFRVVSQFTAGSEHSCASLEDCLTLEVRAYSPRELYAMNLRPVLAAGEE